MTEREAREILLRANTVLEAVVEAMNDDDMDLFDHYLEKYREIVAPVQKFFRVSTPVIGQVGTMQ